MSGDDAVICQNCNKLLQRGEMPRLVGDGKIVCPRCYEPMAEAASRLQQQRAPKPSTCLGLPRKSALGFLAILFIFVLLDIMNKGPDAISVLVYCLGILWLGLSLTQFARTQRRLMVTALVLIILGPLGISTTLIWIVLTVQRLKGATDTLKSDTLAHDQSIALVFFVMGFLLYISGLAMLAYAIFRELKSKPPQLLVTSRNSKSSVVTTES